MTKEGLLNSVQRGALKDLILDYDQQLSAYLQEYEQTGDREKLYYNFIQTANQQVAIQTKNEAEADGDMAF